MKKLLIWIAALALMLALVPLAQADALPEFEFDASQAALTAYNGPGGEVAVPAEIDGARVWDIKGPLFNQNEAVTAITLPEGFDVLNDNVISQIPNLTRIDLPQSLRVIDRGNVQLLDNLTEITVPAGVCYISDNCFTWCQKLTKITFTGVCPLIADFSFSVLGEGCVVYVPDDQYDAYRAALPEELDVQPSGQNAVAVENVTPEDQFAFDPATGTITGFIDRLARMDIPAEIGGVAVKAIGESAFRPAYHLQYLNVPDGVETIGNSAFAYTNSILYIGLPDSVRQIGDEAFLGAIRGSRFHWPASLETIGNKAFYNCYFTDDLDFTPALRSIGDEAFSNAWPENVILPEGCQPWIGSHAFDSSHLDYIQMDSYEFFDMAPDAFVGSYLRSVDLPWDSGWENRLAWQDYFGQQVESTTVYINNPPDCEYTDGDDHLYEKGEDSYYYLTQYNDGKEAPYLYYNIWDNSGDEQVLVECHGLGDGVFKGNQTIKRFRVTHANWPCRIGAEAFADSSVELVDLFYTTEAIGAGAFRNCVNLTELTLPASLTSIGAGAFDGCENLRNVTVLCDPAILPENAFVNCAALMADPSGIHLGADASDEAVARLSAEMGCPWYAPLLREGESPMEIAPMPNAPTDASLFEFNAETGTISHYWGDEADVVVPREIDGVTVTGIDQTAFEPCFDYTDSGIDTNRTDYTLLRSVVLPETIVELKDSTFNYCQQLETFICYAPLRSTGRGTFRLCKSLDNVVFVNGVKMIDNYCFESAGPLNGFYNPVPLDYIGECAFINSGVSRFVADATKIGNCAFRNCPNLTELHFTDRVAETEGAVAYDCPALALVCFEREDMEPFSPDGCIANCSDWLKVQLPADASEELQSRAQSCITWGTQSLVALRLNGCDRAPEAMPDIEAILAGYAANPIATPEPVVTPEPIVAQPVGEAGEPFLGAWTVTQLSMGGETYPASDFYLDVGFTLNADGTALMRNTDGSEGSTAWTVRDGAALLDGMTFFLTEDGGLTAEQEGMTMILRRDGETPAEPEPEPEPEPAPEPESVPEPVQEPEPAAQADRVGVKLTCVAAEASGYGLNPSQLGGEYAITFNADGTAEFLVAGSPLPNLTWTQDGSDRVIDYYGQGELRFVPTQSGYTLDYMGAMTLTFE